MTDKDTVEGEEHEAKRSDTEVKQILFDEEQAINAEPHDGAEKERSLTPWRPEDAADFLAKTIRESQRPLTEALSQRGVPTQVVLLGLLTVIIFAAGLFYLIIRLEQQNVGPKPEGKSTSQSSGLIAVYQDRAETAAREVEELKGKVKALTAERDESLKGEKDARVKLEKALAAGTDRIEELSAQLASQDELGARLAKAEEMVRKTIAGRAADIKAVKLLKKQLVAQAKEVEALRSQLDASRELNDTLGGNADGLEKDNAAPPAEGEEEQSADKVEEDPGEDKGEADSAEGEPEGESSSGEGDTSEEKEGEGGSSALSL